MLTLPARSFRTLARLSAVALLAASLLMVLSPIGALASTDPYVPTSVGYDVSFPDCSKSIGTIASNGQTYAFGVVGVTDGRAFTNNPCLAGELQMVVGHGLAPSLYMNTNAAIGSTAHYANLGPKTCAKHDTVCKNYNYGYQSAIAAHTYATSQGVSASTWWLDVETANSWTSNNTANTQVVQGAIDSLHSLGVTNVGVYSSASMWASITGNAQLGAPVWVPGAASLGTAKQLCTSSFDGGPVWLVQYVNSSYDEDYAC